MNAQTSSNALAAAQRHATDLLTENWPDIVKALGYAAIEASKHDKSLKFKVAVAITIEPAGDEARVSASIAYGVRRSEATDPQSVGPLPLFERVAGAGK